MQNPANSQDDPLPSSVLTSHAIDMIPSSTSSAPGAAVVVLPLQQKKDPHHPAPLDYIEEQVQRRRVPRAQRKLVNFFIGPLYREDIASIEMPLSQKVRYFVIMTLKKFFGELFGTFALVFCITALATSVAYAKALASEAALERSSFDVDNVAVAFVHGLTLTGLIYAFGPISGAHLNPGVTLSLMLSGSFHWIKTLYYWIAQFAGAFIASAIVYGIFGNVGSLGANIPLRNAIPEIIIFSMELILVWIFFFVINIVQDRGELVGKHAAIAVGATFAATALVAGPVTSISFNIARTVAPAVISGSQEAKDLLWAYISANVVAAVLATITLRFFRDLRQGPMPPLARALQEKEREVSMRQLPETSKQSEA